MTFDISAIARPNILTLEPYRCARDDFKEGILLDANENTHGPSFSEMSESEKQLELNRYPDPHQPILKQQIVDFRSKERNDVEDPKEKLSIENLCLGVGSDESIDSLMRCFITPGKEKMILCPPTYGMYSICGVINDVEIVKVPLDLETFDIIPENIVNAIRQDSAIKLVYITSPGNPTSKKVSEESVLQLLKSVEDESLNVVIVIDEAYIDFAPVGSSLCTLVNKHPNLIVLQTLSKAFALAGIRLGITFSNFEISRLLNSMKYPYNISNLTSDVAIRATKESSLIAVRTKIDKIIEQRDIVLKKLLSFKYVGKNRGGLDANFVLIEILNKDLQPDNEVANKLYLTLATQNKIVVRFRGKELGCTGCLRVSIGTAEENAILLETFEKVLNEINA